MKFYECPRCGYKTEQKARMRYHINRKNICPPIVKDINLDKNKILEGIGKLVKSCKYCNKEFSRPDTKNRHEKTRQI